MSAIPGRIDYDTACARCGQPVAKNKSGYTCFQCGHTVTAVIPMEQAKHVEEKAVQMPLIKPGRAE